MNAASHMSYILATYAAALVIVAALIAWVYLDYRSLRHTLAEFEGRGVTRRSDQAAKQIS
jgi:heme exporter protein D